MTRQCYALWKHTHGNSTRVWQQRITINVWYIHTLSLTTEKMSKFSINLHIVTDVCLYCFVDKQYTHGKKQVCVTWPYMHYSTLWWWQNSIIITHNNTRHAWQHSHQHMDYSNGSLYAWQHNIHAKTQLMPNSSVWMTAWRVKEST